MKKKRGKKLSILVKKFVREAGSMKKKRCSPMYIDPARRINSDGGWQWIENEAYPISSRAIGILNRYLNRLVRAQKAGQLNP